MDPTHVSGVICQATGWLGYSGCDKQVEQQGWDCEYLRGQLHFVKGSICQPVIDRGCDQHCWQSVRQCGVLLGPMCVCWCQPARQQQRQECRATDMLCRSRHCKACGSRDSAGWCASCMACAGRLRAHWVPALIVRLSLLWRRVPH